MDLDPASFDPADLDTLKAEMDRTLRRQVYENLIRVQLTPCEALPLFQYFAAERQEMKMSFHLLSSVDEATREAEFLACVQEKYDGFLAMEEIPATELPMAAAVGSFLGRMETPRAQEILRGTLQVVNKTIDEGDKSLEEKIRKANELHDIEMRAARAQHDRLFSLISPKSDTSDATGED